MVAVVIEIARWALAFGFLGIVISIIIQYQVLSSAQKKKYRIPLIIAIALTGFATLVQMAILV